MKTDLLYDKINGTNKNIGAENSAPINGTALFVKPKGVSLGTLKNSSASVCDNNLIPTLVSLYGLNCECADKGYFDIGEEEQTVRTAVRFLQQDGGVRECYIYSINGNWREISSWTMLKHYMIENFYR